MIKDSSNLEAASDLCEVVNQRKIEVPVPKLEFLLGIADLTGELVSYLTYLLSRQKIAKFSTILAVCIQYFNLCRHKMKIYYSDAKSSQLRSYRKYPSAVFHLWNLAGNFLALES
jgi:predicted translin family RNA/ssDNA-binding protein